MKVKWNNQEASALITLGFQGKYKNKYKTRPNVDNHQGPALRFGKHMEVAESIQSRAQTADTKSSFMGS